MTFKRAKEVMELAVYRWFKDHVPDEVYRVEWFAWTFSFLDKHGNDVPVPLPQYDTFIASFPKKEVGYLKMSSWNRMRGPHDPVEIEINFSWNYVWAGISSAGYMVEEFEDAFATELKKALLKRGYDASIRWAAGIISTRILNLETGNPLTGTDYDTVMGVIDSIDIDYELYRVRGDE